MKNINEVPTSEEVKFSAGDGRITFSEFKKLPYEQKNWSMVKNEFNPCPKCGGNLEIKSDWDEDGAQYYICKKCGNIIETEKSEARDWQTDEFVEVYWNKETALGAELKCCKK